MRCIFFRQTGDKREYKTMGVDTKLDVYREAVSSGPVHLGGIPDASAFDWSQRFETYVQRTFVDEYLEVLWYEYHHSRCQCEICRAPDGGSTLSDVEVFERAMLFNDFDRKRRTFYPQWDTRSFLVIFACEEDQGENILDNLCHVKKTEKLRAPGGIKVFVLTVLGERKAWGVAAMVEGFGLETGMVVQGG